MAAMSQRFLAILYSGVRANYGGFQHDVHYCDGISDCGMRVPLALVKLGRDPAALFVDTMYEGGV